MLINIITFVIVFITSSVSASPTPSRTFRTHAKSIQPAASVQGEDFTHLATRANTNAKRLALGLPLLPPKFKRDGAPANPKPSSTPPSASVQRGYLHVKRSDPEKFIGYILAKPKIGTFAAISGTKDDKWLKVEIDTKPGSDGTAPTCIRVSGNSQFPYMGAITGNGNQAPIDKLGSGREGVAFAYFGAVSNRTEVGKRAQTHVFNSYTDATHNQESVQTDIFSIDPKTRVVSVHWVNPDGSTPQLEFIYSPSDGRILIGDPSKPPGTANETVTVKFIHASEK